MITRCGFMKRKKGTTMEEFQKYWLNVHGPIAAKMEGLQQYSQHLVVDNEHRHAIASGVMDIDGYSELSFDTYGDMVKGVESLHGEGAEDVLLFAEPYCPILVFQKKVDLKVPSYVDEDKIVKRVSFLNRKKGVSPERFQEEWWYIHSMLVKTIPGYIGYSQNLVIDRILNGESVPYETLPVAGMVEFWFENMDAFNEFYGSTQFKRISPHAQEFSDAIDTYLTKTYKVVG